MKRHYLGIIALGALGLQNVYAENIKANENDTIKPHPRRRQITSVRYPVPYQSFPRK